MWTVEDILAARTAVLVGASSGESRPSGFNAAITRSMLECKLDRLTLVGRSAGNVAGIPILARFDELEPGGAEVAVVAVPKAILASVVEECVDLDVRACVVITGGLGPTERTSLEKIARGRLRLWGPNCIGFSSTFTGFSPFASDWRPSRRAASGAKWAVAGQSGGGALSIASLLDRHRVNVAQFFTTGDELDVATEDVLEIVATEPGITGCVLFLEEPRDGERFGRALSKLRDAEKPAIVVKVGRTDAAVAAVRSHTGAMVGSWPEFSAAVRASGGVMCTSYEAAVDAASLLSHARGRRLSRSVTVISSSGGASALASDLLERERLSLTVLSDETKTAIESALAIREAELNPIDAGAAGGIARGAKLFLPHASRDPQVDVVTLLHVGPKDADQVGEALTDAALSSDKLITAAWPAVPSTVATRLRKAGIPVFDDPERLFRALGTASTWRAWERVPSVMTHDGGENGVPNTLPETYSAGMDQLHRSGISIPRSIAIDSLDQLAVSWDEAHLAYPVVLKAGSSRGHKSRQGAVHPWVLNETVLRKSARRLLASHTHVVIEERVLGGVELLIAARWSRYGRMLIVGLGGVHAEALAPGEGVVLVAEPFDRSVIGATVAQSAAGGLLRAGGLLPLLSSIVDVGMTLTDLLLETDVWEVEINPLIVRVEGPVAVDVKMTRRQYASPSADDSADVIVQRTVSPWI